MPPQMRRRRNGVGLPELGDGEDAGAVQPFFHARADAVDLLQSRPSKTPGRLSWVITTSPSGFCRSEPTKTLGARPIEQVRHSPTCSRGGPVKLRRELARNLDLALGTHQSAGHLVDRHDLLDREAGADRPHIRDRVFRAPALAPVARPIRSLIAAAQREPIRVVSVPLAKSQSFATVPASGVGIG